MPSEALLNLNQKYFYKNNFFKSETYLMACLVFAHKFRPISDKNIQRPNKTVFFSHMTFQRKNLRQDDNIRRHMLQQINSQFLKLLPSFISLFTVKPSRNTRLTNGKQINLAAWTTEWVQGSSRLIEDRTTKNDLQLLQKCFLSAGFVVSEKLSI